MIRNWTEFHRNPYKKESLYSYKNLQKNNCLENENSICKEMMKTLSDLKNKFSLIAETITLDKKINKDFSKKINLENNFEKYWKLR